MNEIDIILAKIFLVALFNSFIAGMLGSARVSETFVNISACLALIAAICLYIFISIKIITF